jgi:multidrug transporter EmrE-like cation transporter
MSVVALIGVATGMAVLDIVSLSLVKAVSIGTMPTITLLLAIVLYALQPFIFYQALKLQGMAVVNLLWNVISSIIVTLVALLYFKEKLTHAKWIGVFISLLAIGLLTYD